MEKESFWSSIEPFLLGWIIGAGLSTGINYRNPLLLSLPICSLILFHNRLRRSQIRYNQLAERRKDGNKANQN